MVNKMAVIKASLSHLVQKVNQTSGPENNTQNKKTKIQIRLIVLSMEKKTTLPVITLWKRQMAGHQTPKEQELDQKYSVPRTGETYSKYKNSKEFTIVKILHVKNRKQDVLYKKTTRKGGLTRAN